MVAATTLYDGNCGGGLSPECLGLSAVIRFASDLPGVPPAASRISRITHRASLRQRQQAVSDNGTNQVFFAFECFLQPMDLHGSEEAGALDEAAKAPHWHKVAIGREKDSRRIGGISVTSLET